jgi:hypothetical protein
MLPEAIRKRFAEPGRLEKEFLAYLKKAGLKINQSKTIAQLEYYHQLAMTQDVTQFFSGNFDEELTNIQGASFVRPESEHMVIYAIRIKTNIGGAAPDGVYYTPGILSNGPLDNSVITINNNKVTDLNVYPLGEALDGLTTKDQGLILLDEPIIWAGQTSMIASVQKLTSVAFTANTNLRFGVIGIGLI